MRIFNFRNAAIWFIILSIIAVIAGSYTHDIGYILLGLSHICAIIVLACFRWAEKE